MTGFEFAASLVASVAWPVTVLVLAFLFRRALLRLLSKLFDQLEKMTELKAGNLLALKFSESVEAVDERIEEDAHDLVLGEAEPNPVDEDTARLSPRTLVIESWLQLETIIYWVLYGDDPPVGVRRPPVRVAVEGSALPADLKKRIYDLHRLRNAVVHEPTLDVTEQAAREYSRAAAKLGAIIRHPSRTGLLREQAASSADRARPTGTNAD